MRIDVFTIFPDVVAGYCGASILGRATAAGALDVRVHDLRSGTDDPHRSVDDSPFGGGAGMVLMPEPVFRCVESVPDLPRPLYLLAPGGRRFDQDVAAELAGSGSSAGSGGFSLLCGRYEGVDQRVADHLVDGELSVGDFVLAGGELAALVVVEAVARLLPDVLGNEDSALEESFSTGLLEYPQYTRPATFRDWAVPDVLRSGDHGAVAAWRRTQALVRTAERRPDLIERLVRASALDASDVRALAEHGYDVPSGRAQSEEQAAPPSKPE
ncbi:MAG TPA: tRNA (guanosine(37)-N1)-methyltransferase TrmD [Acidimicrobiales bacterium]|nr:tRNA (guanosine(37)-N1)-methyltransferase TrmD [Acidimicrobiales bacterium]